MAINHFTMVTNYLGPIINKTRRRCQHFPWSCGLFRISGVKSRHFFPVWEKTNARGIKTRHSRYVQTRRKPPFQADFTTENQ
jgi:hypothetical protein